MWTAFIAWIAPFLELLNKLIPSAKEKEASEAKKDYIDNEKKINDIFNDPMP